MAKIAVNDDGKKIVNNLGQIKILYKCRQCNHFALQFEGDDFGYKGYDGICFHEEKKKYIKDRMVIDESCRLEDVPEVD